MLISRICHTIEWCGLTKYTVRYFKMQPNSLSIVKTGKFTCCLERFILEFINLWHQFLPSYSHGSVVIWPPQYANNTSSKDCHCVRYYLLTHIHYRADAKFAPSQWETSLQSNAVSHWLGANLESALHCYCWPEFCWVNAEGNVSQDPGRKITRDNIYHPDTNHPPGNAWIVR